MKSKSYTVATAHCPECDYEGPLDYESWKREDGFINPGGCWVCPECENQIAEDLIAFDEIEPDYHMRGE